MTKYPTATCPYCQKTFERRHGKRQKVCKNAECQKGYQRWKSFWGKLYGPQEIQPPTPDDIRKRQFTRCCIGCKKDFTFTTYIDADGKPRFSGGKDRQYCKEKCFDKHYREELITKDQIERYRKNHNAKSKQSRDNLADWYVKDQLRKQLGQLMECKVERSEISQEMIEDKRALLEMKRAYVKATGKTLQSLAGRRNEKFGAN